MTTPDEIKFPAPSADWGKIVDSPETTNFLAHYANSQRITYDRIKKEHVVRANPFARIPMGLRDSRALEVAAAFSRMATRALQFSMLPFAPFRKHLFVVAITTGPTFTSHDARLREARLRWTQDTH